jgi:Cdc6-like AAA superfamily ATPase
MKQIQFDASMADDDSLDTDAEVEKRRASVYSVEALRAASQVDKIYVNHPSFASAVHALDRIFQLAPELDMPQGMLLTGPTGSGKTTVFKYFSNSLPPSSFFAPGFGAISIRCTKRPSAGFLIGALLRTYRYPFSTGTGKQLYARREVVFDAIREKKTRLLFLDEAGGLLSPRDKLVVDNGETDVTDFLRELMDTCRVGVVMATKLGAGVLDTLDDALASRISVRQSIQTFKPNEEWQGMMNAIVKQCKTFDVGLISTPGIAKKLNLATNGNLRGFKRLLAEAILIAYDAEKLVLSEVILAKAFVRVYGEQVGRPNVFQ